MRSLLPFLLAATLATPTGEAHKRTRRWRQGSHAKPSASKRRYRGKRRRTLARRVRAPFRVRQLASLKLEKHAVYGRAENAIAYRYEPGVLVVLPSVLDWTEPAMQLAKAEIIHEFAVDTRYHQEVQRAGVTYRGEPVIAELLGVVVDGGKTVGRIVRTAQGAPLRNVIDELSAEQRSVVLRQLETQTRLLREAGYYHGDLTGGGNIIVERRGKTIYRVRLIDPKRHRDATAGQKADQESLEWARKRFAQLKPSTTPWQVID